MLTAMWAKEEGTVRDDSASCSFQRRKNTFGRGDNYIGTSLMWGIWEKSLWRFTGVFTKC